MAKTVRYTWDPEIRYVYDSSDFKGKRTRVPLQRKDVLIFVNILEWRKDLLALRVKLFLPDGEVMEGWIGTGWWPPVKLHNFDELFDGRFNQ